MFRGRVSAALSAFADQKNVRAHAAAICAALAFELVATAVIIIRVPYTEIDWIAYMDQIRGYQGGEREYTKLRGPTGPLVYPAGFVHLFNVIEQVTGGDVGAAQVLFGALYLATQATVMCLFASSKAVPPYAHFTLVLSKRLHSIYVLRLFNDCWATLFSYVALALLCCRQWALSIICYSLAVSVKMNVLLAAPGVLAVCLLAAPLVDTVIGVVLGGALQVLLAWPFLAHDPAAYLSRAFEFSRVFLYKWTVNWKMFPEEVFLGPVFARGLLVAHVAVLCLFWQRAWARPGGDVARTVQKFLTNGPRVRLQQAFIVKVVLVSNFIGIVFARSLHYQFYSWYFHSLPFLLWQTNLRPVVNVLILVAVEVGWNVFPAVWWSSTLLLCGHLLLLVSLWRSRDNAVVKATSC